MNSALELNFKVDFTKFHTYKSREQCTKLTEIKLKCKTQMLSKR